MEVRPYEGVGPLSFGMSPSQAGDLLGAPEFVTTNRAKETVHRYRTMLLTYDGQGLVEVGVLPEGNPRLGGLNPLTPEGLAHLATMDGDARETLGFVVLLNLGITVTGVHDNDPAQLAATAFRSGRWDQLREVMSPFPMRRSEVRFPPVADIDWV